MIEITSGTGEHSRRAEWATMLWVLGARWLVAVVLAFLSMQPLASEPQAQARKATQYNTAAEAVESHRARLEQAEAARESWAEPRYAPWHLETHGGRRSLVAARLGAAPGAAPSLFIGPSASAGSADLAATNSANMPNASMRLGLELQYGGWLVDINFLIAFNSTNASEAYNCNDRAARCLPEEVCMLYFWPTRLTAEETKTGTQRCTRALRLGTHQNTSGTHQEHIRNTLGTRVY